MASRSVEAELLAQSSEVVADLLLARLGAARRTYTHHHKLDVDTDESLYEIFNKYCGEVESTATWGGQLELVAHPDPLLSAIPLHSALPHLASLESPLPSLRFLSGRSLLPFVLDLQIYPPLSRLSTDLLELEDIEEFSKHRDLV
ncbi:hypothetical protein Sjap_009603 [Stephania japonica]|uniref:Uncharacterized protein n=1 Tax=Stephania japonica TaxID=461633 RepID=A0AAP0JSG8_9MAGN